MFSPTYKTAFESPTFAQMIFDYVTRTQQAVVPLNLVSNSCYSSN